jgi:hypothetical protein
MSTAAFSLTYDGDALKAGQMNVEELAPALLGIGKLFDEANFAVNGREVKLSVQVSARFEKGSFLVNLSVDQGFVQHIVGLFADKNLVTVQHLLELLLGSGGLIGLLRALKGKKPITVDKTHSGNVIVRAEDDSTVTVNQTVYNFYENSEIRGAVYPIVKPLERDGIDTLEVRSAQKKLEQISKADLPALATPVNEEEILHDTEFEATLRIVAISFQEDNKWRLSDGKNTYFYAIEDDEFLKNIDQQSEVFAKDDYLRARIRVIVRRTAEGEIRTDRILVSVLDHIRAPKQSNMLSENDQDET